MTFSVTVLDLIFVLNSMKCGGLKGYFRFFLKWGCMRYLYLVMPTAIYRRPTIDKYLIQPYLKKPELSLQDHDKT